MRRLLRNTLVLQLLALVLAACTMEDRELTLVVSTEEPAPSIAETIRSLLGERGFSISVDTTTDPAKIVAAIRDRKVDLPSSFRIQTVDELRGIFAFYSMGFFAMSLIISQLYRVALRSSTSLGLNPFERRITKLGMQVWAVAASFGPLVIVLMFVLPDAWVSYAGYVYFGLFLAMRLPGTKYLSFLISCSEPMN